MEICNCVETGVRMVDLKSEWFEVKVGIYQSSVVSLLLFAILLDEITKDVREGTLKEFFCADDLVLLGNWKYS